MAQVLTQKQIDDLLGNLQSGVMDIDEVQSQSSKKVKEYDFRSPKKFTREQLKFLNNIYDNFARLFGLQLSSLLRVGCEVETVQVEEQDYREFNNALDDSVLVGVIALTNEEYGLDGKPILLEIARPLSFAIIDRLLGGQGNGYNIEREYTDIELSLMEYWIKQIVQQMQNAWVNYADIQHNLDMIETNSRLIQSIPPDEAVVIIVMEMTVENLKGNVNICLPASALECLFKLFNAKFYKATKKGNIEIEKEMKENLMGSLRRTSLNVSGILGETEITLKDLLELKTGDLIALDNLSTSDSVLVKVENVPWFTGSLGYKKKKYAVKVKSTIQ